jgi:tripartite-type tricarboxylate transporter receptor subunit TctC
MRIGIATKGIAIGGLVSVLACAPGAASADDAVASFYKGRSLDLYIGTGPSGGYDSYGRLVGRHLPDHLPGQPTVVYRNMPGASGIVLAGYMYNKAPRDGSAIAILHNTIVVEQLLGQKVQFDSQKFQWLGSVNQLVSTCIVSDRSGIKSFAEIQKRPTTIGATGSPSSSTSLVANVLNTLAGAKFKIIRGYPSTVSVELAMERGEVDGLCGVGTDSLATSSKDALDHGRIKVVVQVGQDPDPMIPGVPEATEFAVSPEARDTMEFLIGRQYFSRPFAAPPGTPAERVKALRAAFDATVKDPKFVADAERVRLPLSPVPGPVVQDYIHKLFQTPQRIRDLAKEAAEPKEGTVAQAKLDWRTTKGAALERVEKNGRRIVFKDGGKDVTVSTNDAKVTVAGGKAKASALKAGMTCDVVHLGDGDAAREVTCR